MNLTLQFSRKKYFRDEITSNFIADFCNIMITFLQKSVMIDSI